MQLIASFQVAPHLSVIVRQRQQCPQFVTHLHNTETGGYSLGYYASTLPEAAAEFSRRIALYV